MPEGKTSVTDLNMSTVRTFVTLAELRSTRATGKRLDISPSSVHVRIKSLEKAVGMELLERAFPPDPVVQGRTQLTAAGRDFLPRARAALKAHDDLFEASAAPGTEMEGRLLAERLIEQALKALHHNLPQDELERLHSVLLNKDQ